MRARKIYLAILLLIFVGCKKEAEIKPLPEAGYPTTYNVLSQSDWDAKNMEFQKINIHDSLILNEYGFVEGEVFLHEGDSLIADFVVDKISNIIDIYSKFMGIPKESSINLYTDLSIWVPYGSMTVLNYFDYIKDTGDLFHFNSHSFTLSQISLNNQEIIGSELRFDFDEVGNTLMVAGNWFPDAFVPSDEIYSKDEAIKTTSDLYQDYIEKNFWVSNDNNIIVKKVFAVKKVNSKIKIHECWYIYVQHEFNYYEAFVDTQLGELIKYDKGVVPF